MVKPFHEIILQVGTKDDMSAESEDGQLAAAVLDEYMRGFQERNPQLWVFSAHLHMDEATPHLHIDFVPFTTGSKWDLDTRVSLKQALAAQGFKGGTRGDTEWSQWVRSEKEQLEVINFPLLSTTDKRAQLESRLFADMVFALLSYVAQREREHLLERQREGIDIAKRNGTKFGRPKIEKPTDFPEVYAKVQRHEITAREAMRQLNLKPNSYYRFASEESESNRTQG